MSTTEGSQTSSKASRAGKRRNEFTTGSLFPMLKALSSVYHPSFVIAGVAIEIVQLLSFALNPHVSGHQTTWRILYISQLPFWDGIYSEGVAFAPAFVAMYWVVTIWPWLFVALTFIGLWHPHTVSTRAIKPFFRHVVNLYLGAMFVPSIHALLTTMACTPTPPALATQVPNTLWLFPGESCGDAVAGVHRGISIALGVLWPLLAIVMASGNFPTELKHKSIKKRSHPYVDVAVLVYKLSMIICYHLLISRGLVSYYSLILAVVSATMAFLFGFVLPYTARWMNTLHVVCYALVAWCSLVAYIDVKRNTPTFVQQGGFFAVLVLGAVVVGALSYVLANVRYCAETDNLFKRCTMAGFVPSNQNPFAIAAQSANPELLPFPKRLPTSDFVFSPHRFVEMDVIEEALRMEDDLQADGSPRPAGDTESTQDRMQKYITRVQVVSPTIDVAWLPTDAEVSTRFLEWWMIVTDAAPTPHMLSFACRIFARFLLKYPTSPTTTIAYVRFLTEFAPSLSRMNLSVKLLDNMGKDMFCDVFHLFQIYSLTMSVKEVLGVRDKNHERMYRRSRRLHKETLVQNAALWRSLLDEKEDYVQLCFLANALCDVREQCTETYLQSMSSATDDEVLFRSFANFVEVVSCNKECAVLCLEEGEAISRRRRAKLSQRIENGVAALDSAQGGPTQSMSKSSMSRLHRGDDDAAVALHRIIESVEQQTENISRNLNGNIVYYSAAAMFVLLCCVVIAHAVICLTQFSKWELQTDRTYYAGDVRTTSQEIVAALYRITAQLPTSIATTTTTDLLNAEVNKLLATTYAFEAAVNYMTYGAGRHTDKEMVKFIKAPQVFLNIYSTPSKFEVESYTYWTMSNTLVQYLTRICAFALTVPTQTQFLENADVLFVTRNVPERYSEVYELAAAAQRDADDRLGSSTSVAFGVSLAVFSMLTLAVVYVFVWNFRQSASARVQALRLFYLIPKDALKRLCQDAKSRVEKFVSGDHMENDDHARSMELGDGGDQLAGSMHSGGRDERELIDEDDLRRTSYTSRLLAHLFQHGGVDAEDEDEADGAANEPAESANEPATAHTTEAEGGTTQVAGSDKEDAAVPAESAPTFAAGDARQNAAAKDNKQEGGKRRHSISIGSAMKTFGDSKRQRGSILEMLETNSTGSDEDGSAPSPQDVVEAELHGSSNTVEEDESDLSSFSRMSGLTRNVVVLLIAITATVIVGIAFASQVISDDAINQLKLDVVDREIECGDLIRDESLNAFFKAQRFVASGDYEDYQDFAIYYKAFMTARRVCLNDLPSLKRTDANLYIHALKQFQTGIEIAVALVAAEFPEVESALFGGMEWETPVKAEEIVRSYTALVPDIETSWFVYTNQTHDLALPASERRALAARVLYDSMGKAVFYVYLQMQEALALAISKSYSDATQAKFDALKSNTTISVVMWGITALLCIAFSTQWTGSTNARRCVWAVACFSAVCVIIGSMLLVAGGTRFDNREAYSNRRLQRAVVRGHLSKHFFTGYRSVYIRSDAALYDFLDTTQPLYLSKFQGAVVLQLPFGADHSDEIYDFINDRGDANRMIMVAAKLVESARGTTLFDSEGRMLSVQWDRRAESKDPYLTLLYPTDDGKLYVNHTYDLGRNATEKYELAASIMATKRLSKFTSDMLTTVGVLVEDQKAGDVAESSSADGSVKNTLNAFIAIAAVACLCYAAFVGTIAVASIKSFSKTQVEADMYDALYSGHSLVIGIGLSLVAACIVATGALAIAFTTVEASEQTVLDAAQNRAFLASRAMSYAEAMYFTSSLNTRVQSRLGLRDVIDDYSVFSGPVYFDTAAAFSLRKSQNEALFGAPGEFSVRDTRNSLLSIAADETCYNPANSIDGNQQSVTILMSKFFEMMIQIAHIDVSYFIGSPSATQALLQPYLEAARGDYDTLMYVLRTSDDAYRSEMVSVFKLRFNVLLAILILALAIIFGVLFTTVIPIVQKLSLHEAGTKLLLTLLPDDVLNTCPEITDFYDANAGTRDDQIKKKLLQSEKLLQNILPPVISRRLKNGESVIADTHPNVTVVFAALIGFDEYSSKMEAKKIVHFLNSLIVTFDQITDLLELEKIKTIGDIYFLCGGLTKKTESDHPLRCMECALLFLEAIGEHNVRHETPNLTLRIGVNTDPAVAGVIGSKKVAYDLWGDSVNTASRMQSTGLPGKIQVSDKTFQVIKEYYAFTDRKVAAKGKGELTTHIFANRTKPTPYRNLNWRVSTR